MTQKIIFLDVDGTLVGFKDGKQYIPKSAINAIKKARENNHLVYLCTGRSLAEMNTIPFIEVDGRIGAAGGFLLENDQFIFHHTLSQEQINKALTYLNNHDMCYCLECNDGLFYNQGYYDYMKTMINEDNEFFKILKPLKEVNLNEVNKITFMSKTTPWLDVYETFHEEFYVVRSSYDTFPGEAGELSLKGVNKATAIQATINLHHIDIQDTIGFGDSMNDTEMFQCVATSVAMGNSRDGLKEIATIITSDLDDDGLYHGFKTLKLI